MNLFKKFVQTMDNVAKVGSIISISIMITMIVLQVVYRYVLGSSISYSEELARFMFIWSVSIGSAMALKRRSHVSVELVTNVLPKVLKKYAKLLAGLLAQVFYLVLIIYGFNMVRETMTQTSPALGLAMGYVYLAVPISGILMFLNGLYNIFEDLVGANDTSDLAECKEV